LLIKGPLALIVLTFVMYSTGNLLYAIMGLAAGRLLVLLLWDIRTNAWDYLAAPPMRFVWNNQRMGKMLRLALPLGLVAMLASVNANIPRYFLEANWGQSALGIYSPLASLFTAGALIVSSMGQTLFVPTAQAHARGDVSRYRNFVLQAVGLATALGLSAVLLAAGLGREILGFLFGPEYAAQTQVFLVLACAGSVSFFVSGLGYILTAVRSLRPQVLLMSVSAIVTLALCAAIIPKYGLVGTAAAVGLSSLVQLAGTVWILVHVDRGIRSQGQATLHLAPSAEGVVQ
jgi:O-antigen/teichoic acid export membrane protein